MKKSKHYAQSPMIAKDTIKIRHRLCQISVSITSASFLETYQCSFPHSDHEGGKRLWKRMGEGILLPLNNPQMKIQTKMNRQQTKRQRKPSPKNANVKARLSHPLYLPASITNHTDDMAEFFNYTTKTWPMNNEKGKRSLRRAGRRGCVLKVPAVFDEHNKPIVPTTYEEHLKGAIITADCILQHFVIENAKDSESSFTTDLIHVQILAPPPSPDPATDNATKAKKRKAAPVAPEGPLSPKKKKLCEK